MTEVQKWGDDPEMNAKLSELMATEMEAQRAVDASSLALSLLTIKATKVVGELLEDEDPQVRARAVELIYSRKIAKVAAKHVEESGAVVDTNDVVALRESIAEEMLKMKRKQNGNG